MKIHNFLFQIFNKEEKLKAYFFIFKTKSLLNNRSIYFNKGILPYEIKYKYVNIDNLEDLTICKELFKTWSI